MQPLTDLGMAFSTGNARINSGAVSRDVRVGASDFEKRARNPQQQPQSLGEAYAGGGLSPEQYAELQRIARARGFPSVSAMMAADKQRGS